MRYLILHPEDATEELLSEQSEAWIDTEEECAVAGPNGLCCTRAESHEGPHVAHVNDQPVAMWVDIDIVEVVEGQALYALKVIDNG